jgi:hypothetical protein
MMNVVDDTNMIPMTDDTDQFVTGLVLIGIASLVIVMGLSVLISVKVMENR